MNSVLFIALNESWNSPRGKTQFFTFIELRIVEQCELLHLSEQPWGNSRLFYAQSGSKTTEYLFGRGVSLADGLGYSPRIPRPH